MAGAALTAAVGAARPAVASSSDSAACLGLRRRGALKTGGKKKDRGSWLVERQQVVSGQRALPGSQALLSTVMGRPCRRALPLFKTVLHNARSRKLLLLRSPG